MNKIILLLIIVLIPSVLAYTPEITYLNPTPENNSIQFAESIVIKATSTIQPYKCVLMVGKNDYYQNHSMYAEDYNCIYTLNINKGSAYNFSVFVIDNLGVYTQGEIRLFHAGNVTVQKSDTPFSSDSFMKIGEIMWKHNPAVGWIIFFVALFWIFLFSDVIGAWLKNQFGGG